MKVEPQQSVGEADSSSSDLATVKGLLQRNQSTPGKASALVQLLESTQDLELEPEDVGSSLEKDPWAEIHEVVIEEQLSEPYTVENLMSADEIVHASTSHARQRRRFRVLFLLPCYAIGALALCIWNVLELIGTSCSGMIKSIRGTMRVDEKDPLKNDTEAQHANSVDMAPVVLQQQNQVSVNRFELYLKKAFFEETTMHISTTLTEPEWKGLQDQKAIPLFPGWNTTVAEYPLRPQGRFVAETEKAFGDFLDNVEIGMNLQVMGTGGGLSSTGLPGLLKRSFTSYQWLGMWRSSEGRRIRISPTLLDSNNASETSNLRAYEQLSIQELEQLQSLENEVLGLDKYKGGDSEYLTVITHSDDYVGAISLFKAEFSDHHEIIQMDRVAIINDVPREICKILREEIKPNRYELGRTKTKVKCFVRGDLPSPQIVKISSQERQWQSCGGGWRQAFKIPQLNNEYSSGEGLVATIPQMVGLLHLQHLTLTHLKSSPAMAFDAPIDIGEGQLRRGVLLNGRLQGLPHVGQNTRIAVLFPNDSAWAREQMFWA